jgi:branched-chain amino acid transport system ATP-binding protein
LALKVHVTAASYGQTQVLFGVDIEVGDREIVGLFGHNGAGKSTLLRVIAGLHRNAEYAVTLAEAPLTHLAPHMVSRKGLMLVREGAQVLEGLAVQEHLHLGIRLARLNGRAVTSLDQIYNLFPILGQFRKRSASQLSGGQRQLLALGTAFAASPVCLLLDEPSTGLAPVALDAVYEGLSAFAKQGVPLLIAEQNPDWLSRVANRAYLLDLGRITAEGEPRTLLRAGRDGPAVMAPN